MESERYGISDDFAMVYLTYDCNNRCRFCSSHQRVRERKTLPEEEVRAFIESAISSGCTVLDLAGGEPTILPYFQRMVELAGKHFKKISTLSNCRRFHDRDFARACVVGGLSSTGVSIHGSTPELHDELSRVEGAFDETTRGLRNLVALRREGFDLELWASTLLLPENASDLVDLGALLTDIGFQMWRIKFPDGRLVVHRMSDVLPHLRQAIQRYGEPLRMIVDDMPPCLFEGMYEYNHEMVGADSASLFKSEDDGVVEGRPSRGGGERIASCDPCAFRRHCPGLSGHYLAKFGDGELVPFDRERLAGAMKTARSRSGIDGAWF